MTAAFRYRSALLVPSLWAHTADNAPARPRLSGDLDADVVIVGGGFTGLSAAHALTKRGATAVVLEGRTVGWGASGRNGGVVSPKFRIAFQDIAAAHGLDTAKRMHHIAHHAVDTVQELVSEHNLQSAHFERTGFLRCAHNERMMALMRTEVDWLHASLGDSSMSVLDRDQLAHETGSRAFVGGVLTADAGTIHPLNYVRGLASALTAKQVPIYENSPVLRFKREANGVVAETPEGRVRARQLIIATNAYSDVSQATSCVKNTLIPFRSAIIATEPLPAELDEKLMVMRRSYGETRRMMRWFRKVDGRIIFGGRGAFGKEDTPSAFAALQRAMIGLFPDLNGLSIDFKWSGHVAMTLNYLPHVGRLDDRTCFALGYNGTGVAMASLLGRYAAEFALGDSPDVALLDATRLKSVPLYPFREVGVRLAAGWYQLLDAIGV